MSIDPQFRLVVSPVQGSTSMAQRVTIRDGSVVKPSNLVLAVASATPPQSDPTHWDLLVSAVATANVDPVYSSQVVNGTFVGGADYLGFAVPGYDGSIITAMGSTNFIFRESFIYCVYFGIGLFC